MGAVNILFNGVFSFITFSTWMIILICGTHLIVRLSIGRGLQILSFLGFLFVLILGIYLAPVFLISFTLLASLIYSLKFSHIKFFRRAFYFILISSGIFSVQVILLFIGFIILYVTK